MVRLSLQDLPTARRLGWTSTTTLIVVLLMQLGAFSTGSGLARSERPFSAKSVPRASAGPTRTPAFDLGAKYRPPIINFKYQGGPVMTNPIHIYIVWYGTWVASEKNVIRSALSSLTPDVEINQFPNLSNLWKVMTKYYQELPGQARTFVTNKVTVTKEIDDNGSSMQKVISGDKDPERIIKKHIKAGNLPADYEQGVYFVLTASDITFSDNVDYCGYHWSSCASCKSTKDNVIYAFVPWPVSGCINFGSNMPGTPPNYAVSPSGAVDSMIDTIMHELLELTVDPYPGMPAWEQNVTENSEAADVCSNNYVAGEWYYCDTPSMYPDFNTNGPQCSALSNAFTAGDPPRTLKDPQTGVIFNLYGVGGSQYLVQKLWSLDNKGCVLQPEARCSNATVHTVDVANGTIQRGFFFNGVGLQAYAPGQNCLWRMTFTRQVKITFTFDIVALGYDDLDYIEVMKPAGLIVKKLTGFGKNIEVITKGNDFGLRFVTSGSRSPYPLSAGFIMSYRTTLPIHAPVEVWRGPVSLWMKRDPPFLRTPFSSTQNIFMDAEFRTADVSTEWERITKHPIHGSGHVGIQQSGVNDRSSTHTTNFFPDGVQLNFSFGISCEA